MCIYRIIIQVGKNVSGSSSPTSCPKHDWALEGCHYARHYVWVESLAKSDCMIKLFWVHLSRKIAQKNFLNKHCFQKNYFVSQYLMYFQNWMFLVFFYPSTVHCRTDREYLNQNSYCSQLACAKKCSDLLFHLHYRCKVNFKIDTHNCSTTLG